jgi:hypothetical protein
MAETTPTHINSFSRYTSGFSNRLLAVAGAPASNNWPTANLAIYIPLSLPWSYTVNRVFWINGATVGGNCSVAVLDSAGVRLATSGSTVTSGASTIQYVTLGSPLVMSAGRYFLGISFSGTTTVSWLTTGVTADFGRMMGLFQQASAHPIPTTATFASFASIGYPFAGITRTTTGF